MTNEQTNETRPLCRPCLDANGEAGGPAETIGPCARCGAEDVATVEVVWDANLEAGAAFSALSRTARALATAKRADTADIGVARDFRASVARVQSGLRAYLDELEGRHG